MYYLNIKWIECRIWIYLAQVLTTQEKSPTTMNKKKKFNYSSRLRQILYPHILRVWVPSNEWFFLNSLRPAHFNSISSLKKQRLLLTLPQRMHFHLTSLVLLAHSWLVALKPPRLDQWSLYNWNLPLHHNSATEKQTKSYSLLNKLKFLKNVKTQTLVVVFLWWI